MKILIVSHFFYPENTPRAFRTTELANEFARQGHEVKIITHFNSDVHPKLEKEYGYKIIDLGKPKFKSIKLEGNKFSFYLKSILRRLLLLFFEYPNIELMFLLKKVLKNETDNDLMISIAIPHTIHWGVAFAHSTKNKVAKIWVADCGDPYMGCKTDSLKKLFYFKYIEQYWGRKCNFITVPHPDIIADFYPQFREKIVVIPQGFKFKDLGKNKTHNSVPTFAFAGILSEKYRNPKMFLEYLVSLDRDFKFIVYSNFEMLNLYKSKLKNKLEIRKQVPRIELLDELMNVDFLINIENISINSNNLNYSAPSKLIDYAIIKKPILSINPELINYKKIDQFLNGDYSQQLVIANIDKYRIENVVAEFLKLV